MHQELLNRMSTFLNECGWNYTVTLLSWSLPARMGNEPADYIREALGAAAIVGEFLPVQGDEVRDTIKCSFAYKGDHGDGPLPEKLSSYEFSKLQQIILDDVQQDSALADSAWKFTLSEGHPAYPVFWDFSYIFIGRTEINIIIGSASD